MEFFAWFAHKYIMHGFLWHLHEDHHVKNPGEHWVEKNDSFFIIFATPAIICIILGTSLSIPFVLPIGIGITIYGVAYFFVHDLFIHQRIKVLRKTKNRYFLAIRRAHKVHHKHLSKKDGECFGMLIVPMKYFKKV
ncbi:sterol desaturase family protein [Reichenbachiella versicolor]|uniref:sterol desaturase family protein n=1 Tax=Reichenbachiella versicolor TaxID=1821036 RepID=UPI001FE64C43